MCLFVRRNDHAEHVHRADANRFEEKILSTTRTSTKARLALADQGAVRGDLFTLTGTTAITSFEGCVLRRSRRLGVYPVFPQFVPTYLAAMVRGEQGFTVSVCLNRTTVISTCRRPCRHGHRARYERAHPGQVVSVRIQTPDGQPRAPDADPVETSDVLNINGCPRPCRLCALRDARRSTDST